MTITVTTESASRLFRDAVDLVAERGAGCSPRGLPTREVLGVHLQLVRPRARVVHLPPGRVPNVAFAAAEAVWILSGTDAPWIFTYNDRLQQYADGGVLRGAYGPRLRRWGPGELDQLRRVVDMLIEDPDTRRAVVQLYDPGRDAAGHRDVPCTLGYRFHLRDGRLHMSTTMRSQDAWLGLPYDLYSATILHELVAGWVGAELGVYNHHVDSLHLYEHDLDHIDALDVPGPATEMAPLRLPWDELHDVLAAVLDGRPSGHDGWDALGAAMRSYRLWKSGDRSGAWDIAATICGPLGECLDAWYRRLSSAAPSQGSRTS